MEFLRTPSSSTRTNNQHHLNHSFPSNNTQSNAQNNSNTNLLFTSSLNQDLKTCYSQQKSSMGRTALMTAPSSNTASAVATAAAIQRQSWFTPIAAANASAHRIYRDHDSDQAQKMHDSDSPIPLHNNNSHTGSHSLGLNANKTKDSPAEEQPQQPINACAINSPSDALSSMSPTQRRLMGMKKRFGMKVQAGNIHTSHTCCHLKFNTKDGTEGKAEEEQNSCNKASNSIDPSNDDHNHSSYACNFYSSSTASSTASVTESYIWHGYDNGYDEMDDQLNNGMVLSSDDQSISDYEGMEE